MLERLGPADFEPLIGSSFRLVERDAGSELLLEAVDRYEPQPRGPRAQPFGLVLVGPPGSSLDQRIHALEHASLGRLEIFLVPIGPGPDGRPRYEAVFN